MGVEKNKKSFSELAYALANDYESIYVIDFKDDSYVEYSSAGESGELNIISSGANFFVDLVDNCRRLVWPEDQSMFLRTLKKENVVETLDSGKSFDLRYRLNIDNKPTYYSLKTIRQKGGDIIIGVQNIDKVVRRQQKENEQNIIYGEIAKSLGNMFEVIYYIDIETGRYTQYYTSDAFSELGIDTDGMNFFEDLKNDIEKHIYSEDQSMLLFELDKTNLLNTLKNSDTHSIVYRQVIDGRLQYVSLFICRQITDRDHLVIAVRNINSQKDQEEVLAQSENVFSEMAMALAQQYEVVYRVDINTNKYIEFSSADEYSKLELGHEGQDFFADTQKNMKKDIYPEDYPLMEAAMRKENLLTNLKATGKIFLNYRLMIDDEPQYVTLLAVRPHGDSDHIVIAVLNVDYSKRRTIEFEEAVGSALNMANRDALTGFKNKQLYVKKEMGFDREIASKTRDKFSIVFCDVNGLKQINESKGYKAGDDYILEASKLIKEIYGDHDTYRVGGDEFIIILDDEDYDNRGQFVDDMVKLLTLNRESGKVTFAYGIADYNPETDWRTQDVLVRAKDAMVINKNSLRGRNRKLNPDSEKYIALSTDDKKLKFYELFIKLVSTMTEIDLTVELVTPEIEKTLIEISTMFRLAKAVTRVYRNPKEEAEGDGETLCCFDTGVEGKELLTLRIVTSVMTIATMTVYMDPNEEPLTEEEKWCVELTMRTTLTYVSRNRFKDIVEELAYYDDFGYLNQRSLMKYIMQNRNNLGGYIAIRYNLLHFTLVNQDLGRKAGDMVMKNHFEGLQKIIGEDGMVVRLGGDNFIAIFNYQKMGNVFTYLTEAPIIYDAREGKTVNIRTTVGVYRIPKDMTLDNPGLIIEFTTIAFFAAKGGGNESVVFYNDSLVSSRNYTMKVQREFPEALRNEEFQVYYQPKVNTETGKIIGAEALCRWIHKGEMISPGDFIPMLEETDDICALDFYMLEHVCRDIRRWIDRGIMSIRVSVNLSRKHLHNNNLLDNLLKIIDRHNVPHSCLEIELTETTTDVDFSAIKKIVTGLQGSGIFTSVDDFGMGYSSLNLIRELPWNVLKVDRSFLPTEEDDQNSINSIMFKYVIAMVNELGIECIVEGVETERQLEILRNNNCHYAQGYLFDKPLPVEEFENRITVGSYPVK